jgi:chemosensory pili system protein ChpA (sensor histidine kinase/response regulator)
MNDLAAQSLDLVSAELTATLESARGQLEAYIDGQSGPEGLMRCAEMLHLAGGALKIVEAHGAALLAEEMREACKYLAASKDQATVDNGIETVTRAMVQLPAYIDRLLGGGRDVALILLPLINDLRELTKRPLLSEGTLVLLSSGAHGRFVSGPTVPAPVGAASPVSLQNLAALRPLFQAALLGWIKADRPEHQIDQLIDISRRVERAVRTEAGRQMWYVLTAVLEAVRGEGLEETNALKRLVGQADRQLKRLIDDGEQAFIESPPTDLLNGLLYYVGRASGQQDRLEELRAAYNLEELVPGAEQLAEARNELAGPSTKLMGTVADAIREDLGSVKDALDVFVRTGMSDTADLAPQLEMLKKIADTLGVLGLPDLRDAIRVQAKELRTIVIAADLPGDASLEKIAATLLEVEDTLDKELVRAVAPASQAVPKEESEGDAHYRHVTKTVLGECIVNLSHIKETVVQLLDEPGNVRALDQVAPQLQGITAGLLMLGKTRAVAVVERIGGVIRARLAPGGSILDASELERLADAIVSIEYYMETVASGRSDPWYMLDNAERCLGVIESAMPAPVDEMPELHDVVEMPSKPAPAPEKPAAPEPPAVMQAGEERTDPELVELFIEEAKEEIAAIKRNLRIWRENHDQRDALISLRRSFHTLKGSGRMVGAQVIGEFCWSVEKILNRVINRTLPVTDPMLGLLDEAQQAVPQLIEQLEIGTRPKSDIALLMRRADAIAETGSEAVLANETMQMQVLEGPDLAPRQPQAAAADSIDPVLAEIFAKESRGHFDVIGEYLERMSAESAPYPIDEALFRACHTLLGSANMAAFRPLVTVVAPLAAYIGAQHAAKTGLSEDGLDALKRALEAMQGMVAALESDAVPSDDTSALVADLQALSDASQPEPALPEFGADEDVDSGVREIDPEIAAIFSEEAGEILDNAELCLQELRRDAGQAGQLAEMQRLLHTLKGGARMAGLTTMGNFSHSLEDLLAAMAVGRLAPSDEAIAVVQQSLDQLHHLRDEIGSGREPPVPAALLGRIAGLMRADAAPSRGAEGSFVATPAEAADADDEQALDATGIELEEFSIDDTETIIESGEDFEGFAATALSADDLAYFDAADATAASADEQSPAAVERDEAASAPAAAPTPSLPPTPAPADTAPAAADEREPAPAAAAELVRVDAELLDTLLNGIGEISIFHSRLAQQASYIDFNLGELDETVVRLREQLRQFEALTEAQILNRNVDDGAPRGDFDPLELDRYSKIQQLSRALAETANDVASINDLLRGLSNETSTLLTQQARVTTTVQDGLMQTRMIPFHRYVPRLTRIVRQVCADTGKLAELVVEGGQGELDRQVIEHMLAPLEHLLRNAIVHGIEPVETRRARGKPEAGRITMNLQREGSEVLIQVADDGAGLDLDAIRAKARELGLHGGDQPLSDQEAMELILKPGFSTAGKLTHAAGRGVGMDVVYNQVKKLGGSLRIESNRNQGASFLLRLPYTLAVTHALIVNVGEETFALPLPTVEGVTRVPRDKLLDLLTEDDPKLDYGGISYRLQHLGSFVGAAPSSLPEDDNFVPLVLVRAGENSAALLTDSLEGSREVVVKTLGPHLTGIPGVSGATILGDGRIIVILDVGSLIRSQRDGAAPTRPAEPPPEVQPVTALVVDDSITMRRVTQRLLERHGVRVFTARDGMDAVTVLQEHLPDVILLDIEMPRMDGYQFASHVRNDPSARNVPIIMITSRSGEKHRARAIEIGVNDYLSKPYQEEQLIRAITGLLGREL